MGEASTLSFLLIISVCFLDKTAAAQSLKMSDTRHTHAHAHTHAHKSVDVISFLNHKSKIQNVFS